VTSAPTLAFPTEDKVSEAILRTEKIVKIYGGRAVVNGIDIHVNRGEVVGLLGPNGAGKPQPFILLWVSCGQTVVGYFLIIAM